MLRTVSDQPTLWESVIPECLMGLPGDLAEIDALLDDERFFEPFRAFFDPHCGRPSIPIETYLRMMFLKYRYVRHEAPLTGWDGRTHPLSQQSVEVGGSLTLEAQGRAGSSPDNAGMGRHRQTSRVRQTRREGVRREISA